MWTRVASPATAVVTDRKSRTKLRVGSVGEGATVSVSLAAEKWPLRYTCETPEQRVSVLWCWQ
jgi:hypothetical protein